MKTNTSFRLICFISAYCLITVSVFAQAPQGLNYQAIARDVSGNPLLNQAIGIRFSITDQQSGPVQYEETQEAMTNAFGLITLTIGQGQPTTGSFSEIDWASITPWIQIEIDPTGGTNYQLVGTSQFQSVPYALFAGKSGGESVWDTAGNNIYFDNFVGIGTEDPTSPLSIETDVNEIGFSHTTTDHSVILGTEITSDAALLGTTTDHPLSLITGGSGKFHILTDGRVILGSDADPTNIAGSTLHRSTPLVAQLYMETPINNTGWLHVGGADSIIVAEGIGGVSAALGTVTNHIFRLNAGGQGRLHLFPDGNVVVGSNSDGALGKFTVHTPNNSDGIVHVSDGGIILKTVVGGVSATIGTASNHTMRIVANSTAVINIEPNGTVGIGTTNPAGYRLAVNGNIRAKEIVVETGWADYVFDQHYRLTPLNELESYIKTHHRLPNIPSAEDISDNGLHVGEVQQKMMEKIEELTLHIIELNKRIYDLEHANH